MPKNIEALRLPDPLLVRLYREGTLDKIANVNLVDAACDDAESP